MKMRLMLGMAALGLSLPVMAVQDLTPYVGVDAKWNRMGFQTKLGEKLIPKSYPQGNLFAGLKFNEWAAVELGYESTTSKRKDVTVKVGDSFFGGVSDGPNTLTSRTKTRIHGFNANVVGFYPVSEEYCISLFGSVGLAYLKLQTNLDFTVDAPGQSANSRLFTKRKLAPKATIGVQHMLFENIGLRAMFGWEKTNTFRNIYAKNSTLYMAPKNSVSAGLGVFYNFK